VEDGCVAGVGSDEEEEEFEYPPTFFFFFCSDCQARVEQRRDKVLPVPVGDSRRALVELLRAVITEDMYSFWTG